jgi:hypothetical protein
VVGRLAKPQGSAAPAAPALHPLDRSDSRCFPDDKSDGAPSSTSLFAITISPVAGESCHLARCHNLLGQALSLQDLYDQIRHYSDRFDSLAGKVERQREADEFDEALEGC